VRGSPHGGTGPARRLVGVALIVCAAAAAALVVGSTLAARSSAAAAPLAGLDRTYRALLPDARCPAGTADRNRARRLRAAALKGAAKAPPKVLRRKKASMRRAIRLLRRAGDRCDAAPPAGGGGGAPYPAVPPPAPAQPGPAAPAPGTQVVALGTVTSGLGYSPSAAVTRVAGTIRFQVTNNSGTLSHGIGVRAAPPPPQAVLGAAPTVGPGGSSAVDIALGPGTYEIYCNFGGHGNAGMTVPLTITP
jgi:uncharacterized cupredoxin-like copper-binding protein